MVSEHDLGQLWATLLNDHFEFCLAAFSGVWRPSCSLLGRNSSTWASSLAVGTCITVVAALFPSLAACCSLWA